MTTYVILSEDGTVLADSEFVGALKKPIMKAIREQLQDKVGEVKVTVSNNLTFTDFIIKAA